MIFIKVYEVQYTDGVEWIEFFFENSTNNHFHSNHY